MSSDPYLLFIYFTSCLGLKSCLGQRKDLFSCCFHQKQDWTETLTLSATQLLFFLWWQSQSHLLMMSNPLLSVVRIERWMTEDWTKNVVWEMTGIGIKGRWKTHWEWNRERNERLACLILHDDWWRRTWPLFSLTQDIICSDDRHNVLSSFHI